MTRRPATVAEVATVVRDAHDQGTPLRIVGGGSWLGAGGAVTARAERLELSELRGIVDYVPGDLTLTARSGTTLAEIDAATALHGQWCPLLPWGDDAAAVGAVFATATTGPFERALGRPRDLALGLEFVDGAGATVRGGGRVVKNVAGFDLTRLLVGSWGTLGVITELSIRLRARPKRDESWALALDWENDAVERRRLSEYESGPYAPLALERISADGCAAVGLTPSPTVVVRIGGNASFVAASRAALFTLGLAEPCAPAIWTRYRAAFGNTPGIVRVNAPAAALGERVRHRFDPRRILNPGILAAIAA